VDNQEIMFCFLLVGRNMFLPQNISTGSKDHPACYLLGNGDSLTGGKTAGENRWPLTFTQCKG